MANNPFYKEPANQFEQDDEIELLQTVIDKTKKEIHVASLVKIRKGSYAGGKTINVIPMPLRDGKVEKTISCLVAMSEEQLKALTSADDVIGTVIFTDMPSINEVNAFDKHIDYSFQSKQPLHSMSGGILINARAVNDAFHEMHMMRIEYSSIVAGRQNNHFINFKVDSSAFTFKRNHSYYLGMYYPCTNISNGAASRGTRMRFRIVRSKRFNFNCKTSVSKFDDVVRLEIKQNATEWITRRFYQHGRDNQKFAFFKVMEHDNNDTECAKDKCVSNVLCLPINFYDGTSFVQLGYWR